ncbi:hypothetical protein HDV63DRAFT_407857 [Trichoderma sp. SZMC 28014]
MAFGSLMLEKNDPEATSCDQTSPVIRVFGGMVMVEVTIYLQGVLDAAQTARRAGSQAGGDVAEFVNSCLTDAKNYLRIASQFRLSDQAKYLSPDNLVKLPQGAPFKGLFQTKPKVINNVDGVTPLTNTLKSTDFPLADYKVIDWDKTWLASAASTTPEQRATLQGYIKAYGTSSSTPDEIKAKLHQDVIDMQTFMTNLLAGDDLACRSPQVSQPATAPASTKRDITLMKKRTLIHLARKHKL